MTLSEVKNKINSILIERSINAISKLQSKNLDNISKALEFYKKNKHTDKKEPFIKLLKKLGQEKEALAKELDMKVSGMYKNAEYKGESISKNESVNEADTLRQVKKGNSIILKRGNKIYATISQNPNKEFNWTVYFQKGPALSGYKTKKDAIARAQKMSDSLKSVFNKIKGEAVVNEATEPEVITQLRKIVKDNQNALVVDTKSKKKVRVDMQSASLMVQVYDAIKQQSSKDKFVNSGIVQMGKFSWKILNK